VISRKIFLKRRDFGPKETVMLFRLFTHFPLLRPGRVSKVLRHPFVWLPVCTVVAIGGTAQSVAGPGAPPPRPPASSVTFKKSTPAPTPKVKLSKWPHLVAVGPTEVYFKPLAGPRVRRPPLLPTPPTPTPEPEVKTPDPSLSTPGKPPEPSALSPDAPPILLPKETTPATPPPEKSAAPPESALGEASSREPELKDAVMYFETPFGPHGARASIPAIVPLTSPVGAPQPESRAEYRKDKE
jgi:hypothetical protein